MMSVVQIVHTGRQRISETALCLLRIWLFRISLATRSEEQHGLVFTTAEGLDGEVINGGFGLYIDGSEKSSRAIESMIPWDVENGIARRSWARNDEAMWTIKRAMDNDPDLRVTMPNIVDENILENIFDSR